MTNGNRKSQNIVMSSAEIRCMNDYEGKWNYGTKEKYHPDRIYGKW